jgi:hypothetical protein
LKDRDRISSEKRLKCIDELKQPAAWKESAGKLKNNFSFFCLPELNELNNISSKVLFPYLLFYFLFSIPFSSLRFYFITCLLM